MYTGKIYSHEFACEFYAWTRDEKQAYEYRTKKTHDIHAIYIWMHSNSMRLSCEIICAWYLCLKYGTFDTMPFYTVIAWFSQKNPLFLKNSLGTGPWLVEFFHILFQRRKDILDKPEEKLHLWYSECQNILLWMDI